MCPASSATNPNKNLNDKAKWLEYVFAFNHSVLLISRVLRVLSRASVMVAMWEITTNMADNTFRLT
jgi:hypothetical protein